MTRLPLLDPEDPSIDRNLRDALTASRNGTLSKLDGLLLYSDPVARGWHALFVPLAAQCELSHRYRELAIVRLAQLLGARYSLASHQVLARNAGVSDHQLAELERWPASDAFSDAERAVLAYSEEMTLNIQVSDAAFAALQSHFDARQIVELTMNIAGYNMVGRFTEALGLTEWSPRKTAQS